MVMVVQWWEYTWYHFKVIKMVNFLLYLFTTIKTFTTLRARVKGALDISNLWTPLLSQQCTPPLWCRAVVQVQRLRTRAYNESLKSKISTLLIRIF